MFPLEPCIGDEMFLIKPTYETWFCTNYIRCDSSTLSRTLQRKMIATNSSYDDSSDDDGKEGNPSGDPERLQEVVPPQPALSLTSATATPQAPSPAPSVASIVTPPAKHTAVAALTPPPVSPPSGFRLGLGGSWWVIVFHQMYKV